jgi:hypothetical protein
MPALEVHEEVHRYNSGNNVPEHEWGEAPQDDVSAQFGEIYTRSLRSATFVKKDG